MSKYIKIDLVGLSVLVSSLIDWRASLGTDLIESVRKLSTSVSDLFEWKDVFVGKHSSDVGLREREKCKDSVVVGGLDFVSEINFQNRFVQLSTSLTNKSVHLSDITQLNTRFDRDGIANKEDRSHLLSSTGRVKNSRLFSSIFISRDLTFRQREEIRRRRSNYVSLTLSLLGPTLSRLLTHPSLFLTLNLTACFTLIMIPLLLHHLQLLLHWVTQTLHQYYLLST